MVNERNRLHYFILILAVIFLGIGSRFFAKFLPGWIHLFLGDILWALMIFLIFGFLFRWWPVFRIALAAIVFSFLIEISQLYQAPWINAVRNTTLGGLVLGYGFLWSDLLAYLVGVAIGVFLEKFVFQRG